MAHQHNTHQHSHPHQHHHHHEHIQSANKKWQDEHPNYSSIDSAPQTFFYTLTNMLKLDQAKNILQIGCGAGKLLSTVLDLKNPESTYYATDLSEVMIKTAKKRLQAHFRKYQSKLQFQEWLKTQKMYFQVQNGQKIQLKQPVKFDRIVSNMVLCHADDPEKMLINWREIATDDCLLGVSMLGDPNKNHFVRETFQSGKQKNPDVRPPYYWYDKISKIMQKSGWEIILQWDQNTLFPTTNLSPQIKNMIDHRVPEQSRQKFYKKIDVMLNQDKCGIQFWSKIIIAKKKLQII